MKKSVRATLVDASKRSNALRAWSRSYLYARRARQYEAICTRDPVDPKTIVFECYAGRGYTCSPRAIYERMLADRRLRRTIGSCGSCAQRWRARWPGAGSTSTSPGTRTLARRSSLSSSGCSGAEALEHLKRASIVPYGRRSRTTKRTPAQRAWIANYIVPVHMQPREGQIYLQTWHGTPLKRLGCDIAAGEAMRCTRFVTYTSATGARDSDSPTCLSPSPFTSEKLGNGLRHVARQSEAESSSRQGYPRNDFLLNATDEDAGFGDTAQTRHS